MTRGRLNDLLSRGQIDSQVYRETRGSTIKDPRWAEAKRRVPTLDTCLGKADMRPLTMERVGVLMDKARDARDAEVASVRWDDAGALHPANTAKAVMVRGIMHAKRMDAELYTGQRARQTPQGTCMVEMKPRVWVRP